MKLDDYTRKMINEILDKYNGYHTPIEMQSMFDELYKIGIEVFVHNRRDWTEYEWESKGFYGINGEEVENSLFVFQVYENPILLNNKYTIYIT